MSDPNQPTTPPGWYPDGQGGQRWWDGTQWTEHTQPGDSDAPSSPAAPAADMGATVVAPNVAANYGQQGQAPQGGQQFGAPQGGQMGGQMGGQPAYGAPGGGAGGYGAPQWGAPAGGSGGGKSKLPLIIGAAVGALVLAILLLVVLLKVVGGGGPDSVAKDYFQAQVDRDYKKQCELLSKDQQKELLDGNDADDCDEYAKKSEDDWDDIKDDKVSDEDECELTTEDAYGKIDYDIKAGDVEEDGDEAIVELTINSKYTGDKDEAEACGEDSDDLEDEDTQKVKVVKEDGDWKVDDPYYSDDSSDSDSGDE